MTYSIKDYNHDGIDDMALFGTQEIVCEEKLDIKVAKRDNEVIVATYPIEKIFVGGEKLRFFY